MSAHFSCYGEKTISTPHVDRMAADIAAVMKQPAIHERVKELGYEPVGSCSDDEAFETGVPNVMDPLGGSYAIEALTTQIEQQAQALRSHGEWLPGNLETYRRRRDAGQYLLPWHIQRVEVLENPIVMVLFPGDQSAQVIDHSRGHLAAGSLRPQAFGGRLHEGHARARALVAAAHRASIVVRPLPGPAMHGWVTGQYRFARYQSEDKSEGPRVLLTKDAKAIAPAPGARGQGSRAATGSRCSPTRNARSCGSSARGSRRR